jgi:hypothetical protein
VSKAKLIAGWIKPGGRSERTRVTVEVELLPMMQRNGQTVDHQPVVPIFTRLSVQATETERGMIVAGGQDQAALRAVTKPLKLTLDECAELADLWDHWHLNDMRAACIHQAEAAAALHKALPSYADRDELWRRLRELPCPEGYQYGDAWLVEYLPPEVEDRIRELTGMPVEVMS